MAWAWGKERGAALGHFICCCHLLIVADYVSQKLYKGKEFFLFLNVFYFKYAVNVYMH